SHLQAEQAQTQTPKQLTVKRFNYLVDRRPAGNITYTEAGGSCFVEQKGVKFKAQLFVESSVVKIPACVYMRTVSRHATNLMQSIICICNNQELKLTETNLYD